MRRALTAATAYFTCRWTIGRWQVMHSPAIRWAMVGWFLILLFLFEALLGTMLFGRTMSAIWATLLHPQGYWGYPRRSSLRCCRCLLAEQ